MGEEQWAGTYSFQIMFVGPEVYVEWIGKESPTMSYYLKTKFFIRIRTVCGLTLCNRPEAFRVLDNRQNWNRDFQKNARPHSDSDSPESP